MDTASLIKMLNDIGSFYETMPDQSQAIEEMARHIRAFWDPRMREAMALYLEQHPKGLESNLEIKDFSIKAFSYMQKNLA